MARTRSVYIPGDLAFLSEEYQQHRPSNIDFSYGQAGAGWKPVAGDWHGTPSALLAADGAVTAAPNTASLTESALQPLVTEAIARWAAAGLSSSELSTIENAKVEIADLPGAYLGLTEGNTVSIDVNAAGYGWFVDPTPAADEEFASSAGAGQFRPSIRGPSIISTC